MKDMYKDRFEEAIERTKRFGLKIPQYKFNDQRLLTEEKQASFAYALRDKVGEFSPYELVARCIPINQLMKEPVSEIFGAKCLYTIGYIEVGNGTLFKQSEIELKKMMNEGINGLEINLHAWLTLPSMEIIDLTIGTSFGMAHNNPEQYGDVIAKHPDELAGGLKFHPMIIGEDYIARVFRIDDMAG